MIRTRNLSPEAKQWIMSVTGLGPGIGELFYVVPTDSTTSHYRQSLEAQGVTRFYSLPSEAYAAMTANRNDVMLVAPGAYNETASIDWTKDNTHCIGLGGPNTRADYSEKNVVIYTDTAAVDYTIHLTGDHCQFINVGINNGGANAANYGPLYVNGYGNLFLNCSLYGNLAAEQLADDDCASLHIGTNAHNCKWIGCDIGEDCWGARSAAQSGQVSFLGSGVNGGLFKDCFFRSQSATATCGMITTYKAAAGTTHIGRGWLFDNCVFNNFDDRTTNGTNCNQVFVLKDSGDCEPILLHNCSAHGYDRWTDNEDYNIRGAMPVADDGGGLSIALDETVAGGS